MAIIAAALLVAGCTPTIDVRPPAATAGRPVLQGDYDGVFVDPEGPAARWVREHPDHPDTKIIDKRIAQVPAARQVTAPTRAVSAEVRAYVDAAAQQRRQPVLVADPAAAVGCAGPAAGPDAVADASRAWFTELAKAIGDWSALVVIRDGWPMVPGCAPLDPRADVMAAAVEAIRSLAPRALVFLDASRIAIGSSASPQETAEQLATWSVSEVAGVALNVGRYATTREMVTTATRLRDALHTVTGRSDYYVLVDGSRNGGTARGDCNPDGAKLGSYIVLGSNPEENQFLWLSTPGVSDGPCGVAPASVRGQFLPELAARLIP